MHRLKNLPEKIDSRQKARYFILVSMGLDWPISHPDLFNRIKVLLSDLDFASELRNNMIEFYLSLTPEYLGALYPNTYPDTGLTLSEFKYQIFLDLKTIPLDMWVKHQIDKLEIIESWDLT